MAAKYDGKIKVAKLNVDEEPNTAGALGIRALPTLLVFKSGKVVDQVVGAVSKDRIDGLIQSHL